MIEKTKTMLNILCVYTQVTIYKAACTLLRYTKLRCMYQFYAQKLGVGMKETMMDTGVGIRQ